LSHCHQPNQSKLLLPSAMLVNSSFLRWPGRWEIFSAAWRYTSTITGVFICWRRGHLYHWSLSLCRSKDP
jgi:hypothetical protein